MSKEKQGFFGQLKNQIIAGVGVILTGLGGLFMDEVKSFIGIEDSESAVEVVKVKKKYNAHDENNKFKTGDKVSIIESKPFSKNKKFEVMDGSK